MSRVIKFRAWIEEERYMMTMRELMDQQKDMINPEYSVFEDPGLCVEQFTGLYDANGTEIYEGDIICAYLEYKNPTAKPYVGDPYEVKFDWFHYDWDDNDVLGWNTQGGEFEYVIGNIHERPELLS